MQSESKKSFVKYMFDDIFRKYDLLNTILSFGLDRRWRKRTVAEMPINGLIIDICAGGGQLAEALYKKKEFSGDILIADISINMIRHSHNVISPEFANRLLKVVCDAEYLPFKDNLFNGAVSGFGLRNLTELGSFSRELLRTLKPGSRARILELSHPTNKILGAVYRFYFYRVTPHIARLFTEKVYAYKYLPRSLKKFPHQKKVMSALSVNWSENSFDELFGGISVIYMLTK